MLKGTDKSEYIKKELEGVSIQPTVEEVHDMLVVYGLVHLYEGQTKDMTCNMSEVDKDDKDDRYFHMFYKYVVRLSPLLKSCSLNDKEQVR